MFAFFLLVNFFGNYIKFLQNHNFWPNNSRYNFYKTVPFFVLLAAFPNDMEVIINIINYVENDFVVSSELKRLLTVILSFKDYLNTLNMCQNKFRSTRSLQEKILKLVIIYLYFL